MLTIWPSFKFNAVIDDFVCTADLLSYSRIGRPPVSTKHSAFSYAVNHWFLEIFYTSLVIGTKVDLQRDHLKIEILHFYSTARTNKNIGVVHTLRTPYANSKTL